MTKCATCGMIIDKESTSRCPRCNTALVKPVKCESCKGCSLRGMCSK